MNRAARRTLALPLAVPLALVAIATAPACSRTASELSPSPASDASAAATGPAVDGVLRSDAGRAAPPPPRIPLGPGADAGAGHHSPDWDLDPADPARDYVELYIQATKRYGDQTKCVHAQPSVVTTTEVGKIVAHNSTVEVRDAAGPGCPGGNALRDTFLSDPIKDSLELTKKSKPLAPWPDGSETTLPPAPGPQEIDLRTWQGPVRDTVRALQLVPIRVQAYGRGSYLGITVAGFRGVFSPDGGAAPLEDAAKKLCTASGNRPMFFFGGIDRSKVLRVRCPGEARWDTL